MKSGKRIFHIYLDRTKDGDRVFYVGKGTPRRIAYRVARNPYWANIVAKHGFYREVILSSSDEAYVFEIEKILIREFKTFEPDWPDGSGWGANLTRGGEGVSGRTGTLSASFGKKLSEETRSKISRSRKGKWMGSENPNFGKSPSFETRNKMSEAKRGKPSPMLGRLGALNPLFGRKRPKEVGDKVSRSKRAQCLKLSEEQKAHLSKINTGPNNPSFGKKRSREARCKMSTAANGENNSQALLNWDKVREIRAKYATGNYTQSELARNYGVTRGCIMNVVNNKNWKE